MKKYTGKEVEELFNKMLTPNGIEIAKGYKRYIRYLSDLPIEQFLQDEGVIPKFEIGEVYESAMGSLVCYQGGNSGYGVYHIGTWCDNDGWNFKDSPENWTKADPKKWEEARIKEAYKRGYDKKQSKCLSLHIDRGNAKLNFLEFIFCKDDGLWVRSEVGTNCIMRNGEWADFVEEENDVTYTGLEMTWCGAINYANSKGKYLPSYEEAKKLVLAGCWTSTTSSSNPHHAKVCLRGSEPKGIKLPVVLVSKQTNVQEISYAVGDSVPPEENEHLKDLKKKYKEMGEEIKKLEDNV